MTSTTQMTQYEQEAVRRLVGTQIPAKVLKRVLQSTSATCDHTGAGYFLTVADNALPIDRMVLSKPLLIGRSGRTEVGFIVFIMNSELTLECHGWGTDVSNEIRQDPMLISLADVCRPER